MRAIGSAVVGYLESYAVPEHYWYQNSVMVTLCASLFGRNPGSQSLWLSEHRCLRSSAFELVIPSPQYEVRP